MPRIDTSPEGQPYFRVEGAIRQALQKTVLDGDVEYRSSDPCKGCGEPTAVLALHVDEVEGHETDDGLWERRYRCEPLCACRHGNPVCDVGFTVRFDPHARRRR